MSKSVDFGKFCDSAHGREVSHAHTLERQRYLGKKRCLEPKGLRSCISVAFSLPPKILRFESPRPRNPSLHLQARRAGHHVMEQVWPHVLADALPLHYDLFLQRLPSLPACISCTDTTLEVSPF